MDAQNNLKLRRPDRSRMLQKVHENQKSVKRDHIKDILIQNFR